MRVLRPFVRKLLTSSRPLEPFRRLQPKEFRHSSVDSSVLCFGFQTKLKSADAFVDSVSHSNSDIVHAILARLDRFRATANRTLLRWPSLVLDWGAQNEL